MIAREEYPSPRPLVFQSTRGPPAGQEASRPVSLETPSRFGPRHWGQSAALATIDNRRITERRRIWNRLLLGIVTRAPRRRSQDGSVTTLHGSEDERGQI